MEKQTPKMKVVFEMETADPDDFMTLLWLADHPTVDLIAVLVTPGGRDQCQLVRWALNLCNRDIPIGALHGADWWKTQEAQKNRVSGFHYKVYGEDIKDTDSGVVASGPDLLCERLCLNENVTVVVGSAPKNIGALFRKVPDHPLHRWVQQGGFAGDNLVPEEDRLEKFKGRITCPSFNPGGAWKQTLELCASESIEQRRFVSKNVCHGVIWDPETQRTLKRRLVAPFVGPTKYVQIPGGEEASIPSPPPADWMSAIRPGLRTMIHGLDRYLADKGKAKAMHDLVAAAAAVDESVCVFSDEVEIYREKGEWGARPKDGTRTRISIGFDEAKFIEVLAQ